MRITISKIAHYDANKDGSPLVTKDNKPYTRCTLECPEYAGEKLTGFGSDITKGWSVGDEVELDVDRVRSGDKEYLNFNNPKKLDPFKIMNDKLDAILRGLQNNKVPNIEKGEVDAEHMGFSGNKCKDCTSTKECNLHAISF